MVERETVLRIEEAWIPESLLGSEPPDPNVSNKWYEWETNYYPVGTMIYFDFGHCSRWRSHGEGCSPLLIISPPLSLDTLSSLTWLPGPQLSLRPAPWGTLVALFLLTLTGFHGLGFPPTTVRKSKTWIKYWGETEWVSHWALQKGHLAWPPRSWRTSDLNPVVISDEVIPTGIAILWQDGKKTFIHHRVIIYPITGPWGHWHVLNSLYCYKSHSYSVKSTIIVQCSFYGNSDSLMLTFKIF